MEIIYFLIPMAIGLGLIGLLGYWWAIRSGQYDDLETPAMRMLFDDCEESATPSASSRSHPMNKTPTAEE
ncbi:MAG: cbb3-type cytochrome oxidase assembly protein CcoS [Bdellovibrionales bacterium]|nr:cbb3-type cytochrome oxidase assembly protein CcoS [Bdellovibrionales bacterium]